MKQYLRQIDRVIKMNLRQLAVLEVLYRLAAGTFYMKLVNRLLRFSLQAAGYSYLTVGNMGAFLWRPLTIACLLAALLAAAMLLLLEAGGQIASYEASLRGEKITVLSIIKGALYRTAGEWKKRNWLLWPLILVNYLMMNSFLLLRILTKVKPVDFVLYELLRTPAGKVGLCLFAAAMIFAGFPAIFLSFVCMEEQLGIREGIKKSRERLRKKHIKPLALLIVLNGFLIVFLILLYLAITVISAILVTVFVKNYAASAVLSTVCARMELAVLFIGSLMAAIVDFGALAVFYDDLGGKHKGEADDLFSGNIPKYRKRKWLLGVSGLLAGASAFLIFDMAYNGISFDWAFPGQTEITAHRGSSRLAPENTIAALEQAMDEMADYCEVDVQSTADGVVVLCHDLNVKRVSGVNRRLAEMTWEEIEKLDVGSSHSEAYRGEKIPSLREALEACKGRMKLNIELKYIGETSSLPEQVAGLIREYDMEEQCVVTSVSLSYLKRVKTANPDLRTGYILAAAYGRCYEAEYADFISIRSSFVTKRLVEGAHEYGKAVHAWTVNGREELERMNRLGVDNIITDYPAYAREILYGEEGTEGLLEYLSMVLR